ncbi:adenosine kinase [Candidatus Woesearchaeota archaeon]|nr:adenosine kinase [Candidatus Woesearchaeota archaeon]
MMIVGIGNPLLDTVVEVSEEFMRDSNLSKGGMTLVSEEVVKSLLSSLGEERSVSPGGSAANAVAVAARSGASAAFIGMVGDDDLGRLYETLTIEDGVESFLARGSYHQGVCLVLVTPDGERTFATHLGAAQCLRKEDVDLEVLERAQVLHVEGYLLDNELLTDTLLHVVGEAKRQGVLVSLDAGDPGVIERHRPVVEKLVREYADVVFFNEDEAEAYTGLSPMEAAVKLHKEVSTAVVKLGSEGSVIVDSDGVHKVPSVEVGVVNTNGAGDAYAGAFLASLIRGYGVSEAGRKASVVAAKVVSQAGARLLEDFSG